MFKKKRKNESKSHVVSIALMLFAAHAGGGFATGNQANTYFVSLGWAGIISAVISMALLCAILHQAFVMYNKRNLKSYKDLFENLYHPFDKLELVFEAFFNIMVIMVVATTISGAASALKEFMSINYYLATILITLSILFMAIYGADLVRKLGSIMGIIILVTAISIYLVGSVKGEGILNVLIYDFQNQGFSNVPKAIFNGFIYAGFQCVQIPAMVACSTVLKNKKESSKSMTLSFVINSLALVLSITMLLSWKSYYNAIDGGNVLPTLTATKAMGYQWMSIFYVITLVLCLISSGVTIVFGFVSRFENIKILSPIKSLKAKRFTVATFIILISMLISLLGLNNIIKYGYGYCGYIAIAFIIMPFLTIGKLKNEVNKDEELNYKNILMEEDNELSI